MFFFYIPTNTTYTYAKFYLHFKIKIENNIIKIKCPDTFYNITHMSCMHNG